LSRWPKHQDNISLDTCQRLLITIIFNFKQITQGLFLYMQYEYNSNIIN
jgi:hypothetical protein